MKRIDKLNAFSITVIAAFVIVLAVVAIFQLKLLISDKDYTARSAQAAEDNAAAAVAAANAANRSALAAMKQTELLQTSATAAATAAGAATEVLRQVEGAHLLIEIPTMKSLTDLFGGFTIIVTDTGLTEATDIDLVIDAKIKLSSSNKTVALVQVHRHLDELGPTEPHLIRIQSADVTAPFIPESDNGVIKLVLNTSYTDVFGKKRERTATRNYVFQPNGQLDLQTATP